MRLSLPKPIVGRWYAACSLAQFFRYFANWDEIWAAYRRGADKPLPPLKFRGGLTLLHGPADDPLALFREMFVPRPYICGGFYQPRRQHVVVDLGANIGLFALFMQWHTPGIRMHCFEPGAYALDLLRKNLALNRLEALVTVHPYAVSDHSGFSHLAQASHSFARQLTQADDHDAADDEKVATVDFERALGFCETTHVDLLKMDIEGSEYEIVCSTKPKVWRQVDRIALEFHEYIHPDCREVLAARLAEAGFDSIRVPIYSAQQRLGIMQARRA